MKRLCLCLVTCAVTAAVPGETHLVRNPSFEGDADENGVPNEWRAAGDARFVSQNLAVEKGRDGGRCAKLSCTQFEQKSPASHAMLCQMGVPVRRGESYRVAFWARGEDILGDIVSVGLSDTSSWESCGLAGAFAPGLQWRRFEFLFRATRSCTTESRFQIWFNSTGTLWLDDVEFVRAEPPFRRPGNIITAAGQRNLVPNGSFECGSCGWGSAEWDRTSHWGGKMNRLLGSVDEKESFRGQCSLRVDLTPQTQPWSYFDYFDLYRIPISAPLAANIGFIEVVPGRAYTLSAYMKASSSGTPARLAVRQFEGRAFERGVRVSGKWERYSVTFKPTSQWCYVLAGPDLRKTRDNPSPPPIATLWLDAVQLEQGAKPLEFGTRGRIEVGVETDRPGNVFGWDEPLRFRLTLANSSGEARQAEVEVWLTDFSGKTIWRKELRLMAPARGRIEREMFPEKSTVLRGFLRLHFNVLGGDVVSRWTMRLAVIPVCEDDDSRFGMNHAYPWPHLLDLSRKAGLVWVRDWSLKWMEVEPEEGRFTFVETDHQINRPLRHGMSVLCLLPFPSSPWSAGGAAPTEVGMSYEERRAVVARAPKDAKQFANYVERTIGHYKGRVEWFQVFNEPLFTSYALPRSEGYSATDYAVYTKAFAGAARRANPSSKILGGIGYIREGQIMNDFEEFFRAGGLDVIDAVDIHCYPRIRPPEFIEELLESLNALMDRHGGRKPIWLTEYGYYADDEPWAAPMPHQDFNQPLRDERVQAEYAVRWATILFANGVDKIFYHAGTCAGVNGDSLQGVFYEYGGEPHRIYAAQAVMARLLSPTCRFVKRLTLGKGMKGYLFRDGERLVAVVWSVSGAGQKAIRLGDRKLRMLDLMGREQNNRQFNPSATPVYVVGERVSVPAFEAAIQCD